MTGTREDVIAAYLERVAGLVELEGVTVERNYSDALEVASAVYVGEVTGEIEVHDAANVPFRWRDLMSFEVAVQVSAAEHDGIDSASAVAGRVVDACVFALGQPWDTADPRVAFVEPGTLGVAIDGPSPVHYAPHQVWLCLATVTITIARHLYPTTQEINP